MYWSRFNFLYESDKYGFLLYNTRTNALLSLTEKLYLSLREISQGGAFNKLSNEVVNSLKKAKVIVGLLDDDNFVVQKKFVKSIQITIDGLPISHNKSRIHKSGNPTFDVIIKNILRVFSIIPDCHVIIRVNIHKDNKDDYPALYKYLTELFGGNNYSINMSYANDHGNGCKVACFTEKEKLLYIADLMRQHGFNKIDIYPCLQLGGCVATCANSFVVGPLGELYKCWVDVGVADKKVGSIFENKMNLSLISEYAVGTDMFSDENCLQCSLLPICDGGCNLRRFEAKQKNEEFSLCPIDKDKIPLLLDLYYEQKFSRK